MRNFEGNGRRRRPKIEEISDRCLKKGNVELENEEILSGWLKKGNVNEGRRKFLGGNFQD